MEDVKFELNAVLREEDMEGMVIIGEEGIVEGVEEDMTFTQFCERFGLIKSSVREELGLTDKLYFSPNRRVIWISGELVEEFRRCYMDGGPLFWDYGEDRSKPTYSLEKTRKKLGLTNDQFSYLMENGLPEELAGGLENTILEDGVAKIPSLDLPYGILPRIPAAAAEEWSRLGSDNIIGQVMYEFKAKYETDKAEKAAAAKDSQEETKGTKRDKKSKRYEYYNVGTLDPNAVDPKNPEEKRHYWHMALQWGFRVGEICDEPSDTFRNSNIGMFRPIWDEGYKGNKNLSEFLPYKKGESK